MDAATELVRIVEEQGVALTGPDGLRKQLTKPVTQTALNEEMTEHQGHEKHDPAGRELGNIGNGTRGKAVLTDSVGATGSGIPKAWSGTFEPQIVKKRQCSISRLGEVMRSCPRHAPKGLTTGEGQVAHVAYKPIYPALGVTRRR